MSKDKVDVKVVFLGDSSVGKSSLLIRFLDNSFGDTSTTIGASYFKKSIHRQGQIITLGLWDTAGQERYDSLSSFYCRGAECAVVAFDLSSQTSFDNVDRWINKLSSSKPDPHCFIVLVGTKLDLVQQQQGNRTAVSSETIEELMRRHNIGTFIKTSAKSGENVQQVFEKIAETYSETIGKRLREGGRGQSTTVNLRQQRGRGGQHMQQEGRNKAGCC